MIDFLKRFGLFKGFFFIVLPLVFALFVVVSAARGNLGYDLPGYLIGFGAVYAVVSLAVVLNWDTK